MKTSPTEMISLIEELAEAFGATLSGPEHEQSDLVQRAREFLSRGRFCTNCKKIPVSWRDQCSCDSNDDDRDSETP